MIMERHPGETEQDCKRRSVRARYLMVVGDNSQEADMIEAIKLAHEAIKDQCRVIKELGEAVAKSHVKRSYVHENANADLEKKIMDFCYQKYYDVAMEASAKEVRADKFKAIKEECMTTLSDEEKADNVMLARYFKKAMKKGVRNVVLDHGKLAEAGTHTELLRRDGLYADMWARQQAESEELGVAAE